MGLRLFFLTNFLGAMFIQGATFIPDSRVPTLTKVNQASSQRRFSRKIGSKR